ncbi:MAG: SDR family oxidoreductase [Verrucomicrobiota bacterium]|jgi:gluconate 5-dehydrogenase
MAHHTRFSLLGKRALVTGSSQGIGLAIAHGLADAGAKVILNGRSPDKLAKAAESFKASGITVETLCFDVTEAEAITQALKTTGKTIDILVNNTGIQKRSLLVDMPLADWKAVIDTNLTSAFVVTQAVVKGMMERKSGKIVNICSLMSELARPTTGNYAASKGGLKMLTKAMCGEWAKDNIQINGLAPGYISTELTQVLKNDPKFDTWIKGRTPANRWGEVEDLVGACVFLCSPAADFVNGQILTVDGGLSAVI